MKGTRPLNNEAIRRVSAAFTGTFAVRNSGLCFLLVIVGLFTGCGGDTDTADTGMADTGVAMLVEVKPPRVRTTTDFDEFPDKWHAEIDIVFEGIPVDLEAEFDLKTTLKKPLADNQGQPGIVVINSDSLADNWVAANWEQTRNIVTLHFEFPILLRTGAWNIKILPREYQKQTVEVTLSWSGGRKIFVVDALPPESLFVEFAEGIADL